MSEQPSGLFQNQLLADLSEEAYQRLRPDLKLQHMRLGKVLYEPLEPIAKAYFPVTALLSWISLLEDGTLTEIALVGNEGMTGLPIIWGGSSTPNSAIVQFPGDVMILEAEPLLEEFNRGDELNKLVFRYMQAIFTQVAQNAMCNRQHTTEERLARWLLSVQDSVQQDELTLTHEFVAKMLGIRRSSVTVSAGILQQAGMIRYTRGRLSILDRPRLEDTACECYRVVQSEYHRLLGSRSHHS
ncbi:Crp/Fnr family transcriptional regulator [Leptolyngbya sp. BC1307]|uniref:Crp/Fnr family transcriptional regulator n=1 Tax=Leptolyngbya sp. BC1307 TaxID=2029589 RepID=UPI000EFB98E3|nr:Crp/Fnr family transcriptional regulator [Leptolyngbya sp. BC1307]